ncbi:MAG TPA: glycosyltransferase family protein [Anaerolineales bacterium]
MRDPRTVAIIQARMSSSRLPGKVLLDIAGQPMLARVAERARGAASLDDVAVATTTDPSDDPIAALCAERGYPCFRGSLHDVLDRYYQAARLFQAEVIVRLTADCPLIDPGVIDETVYAFFEQSETHGSGPTAPPPFDFAANRLPPPWKRTYPIGLDVEVCTLQALERAWKEAGQPYHREHVMPYLYEEPRSKHYASLAEMRLDRALSPGQFRVLVVNHDPDYGALRWTVDTPEDLELVRQIYARFPGRADFSWLDILALFDREPELARINAEVRHKPYQDVDERRK